MIALHVVPVGDRDEFVLDITQGAQNGCQQDAELNNQLQSIAP
jgi:hypothetical protein